MSDHQLRQPASAPEQAPSHAETSVSTPIGPQVASRTSTLQDTVGNAEMLRQMEAGTLGSMLGGIQGAGGLGSAPPVPGDAGDGPFSSGINRALEAAFGTSLRGLSARFGDTSNGDIRANARTEGREMSFGPNVSEGADDRESVRIIGHEVAHALAGGGSGETELDRAGDPGEQLADDAGERFASFVMGNGAVPDLKPAHGGRARIHRDTEEGAEEDEDEGEDEGGDEEQEEEEERPADDPPEVERVEDVAQAVEPPSPEAADAAAPVTNRFTTAFADSDPAQMTQVLSDMYALQDPEARAAFAAQMPQMFAQMTPEQRAITGGIMMMQGHQFQANYTGPNMSEDPAFRAMAEVQRAWTETTGFQGLDPYGRPIDVSVSTTGEDYGQYQGEIAALTQQGADQGLNVWSDMNLPYSMWTEAGNIARYAGTENITFVGADGMRMYGWGQDGTFNGVNVTEQEREAAATVEQRGEGATVLEDGTTVVQTHMGLNRAIDEADYHPTTGFFNQAGEWTEIPADAPVPTEVNQEDQPQQLPLPGFDMEPITEPTNDSTLPQNTPGNMQAPDPDAPADAPQNAPYIQIALDRAGIEGANYEVGRQTITIGQDAISVTDFQAGLGLDGMSMQGAFQHITANPEQVVTNAANANLNINRNGVIRVGGNLTQTTLGSGGTQNTVGANGSVSFEDGNLTGTGGVDWSNGDASVGLNVTFQRDENGEITSYGGGLQAEYQLNKLKVGGGVSVLDSQHSDILDPSNATGADAAVVDALGGGPVLAVGEEHHLQVDLTGGGTSGPFGASVGVTNDSGTAVTFYQAVDSEMDPAWAAEHAAEVNQMADDIGWDNLDQVFGVSDVDILAMDPGTAFRFDDFSASGANAGASAYGVGVSLGVTGQEYESVMVSRTDPGNVRISVMSTTEEGWNAGVDFHGIGLYGTDHASGDTTLVELDIDITTPGGREALDVFRNTGALPGSYSEEFGTQAAELARLEDQITNLASGVIPGVPFNVGPASPERLMELRLQYAEMAGDLHAQAALGNGAFLESPEFMEHDMMEGVQYAHRMDQQFERDRQTLLGLFSWGTNETTTQDAIWQNGDIDVQYNLDRSEQGFVPTLMRGTYAEEISGSVTNPHSDAFDFGVFANTTIDEHERELLAGLPEPEDPLARAYLNGAIDGIDPVAQVGVFLSEAHIETLDGAFDSMRAAGIDPTAAALEFMDVHYQNVTPMTALIVMIDDGMITEESASELFEGYETGQEMFADVAANGQADFAAMEPAAQQMFVAMYLDSAAATDTNPWTCMDFVGEMPAGEERDALMATVTQQIERMDADNANSAFELIELMHDIGEVDPQAAENLYTSVLFSVTDRDVQQYIEMDPESRHTLLLEAGGPEPGGRWNGYTRDLLGYNEDIQAGAGGWDPEMTQGSATNIMSMMVAAERTGEVDALLESIGLPGSDTNPTLLLESLQHNPGEMAIVLDVMSRSETYGVEVQQWAEAHGIDVEAILAGSQTP